jgi:glutamate/tyrosine decarboxylase-like PLP-dependent enzyme
MIRHHVGLAHQLAGWIRETPGFEVVAPVRFGLVCFRYCPRVPAGLESEQLNDLNRRVLARVNASRKVFLTHTMLGGNYVLRMAIGQQLTMRSHVELAWSLIQEAASSETP